MISLGSLFLNALHPSVAWTTLSNLNDRSIKGTTIDNKFKKQVGAVGLYESVGAATIGTDEKKQHPFAIVVQAEIVPERLDEFLHLIEHNAIQSRQEPECIRFDVIRSHEQSNLFFFYEIYTNNHSAMDHHKSQSHYQAWANFKASGGTISSTTYKTDGLFLTE
jgi:(4S)-4-hydroxy-5-phosphonooxypentane-2,3-dione isomerase